MFKPKTLNEAALLKNAGYDAPIAEIRTTIIINAVMQRALQLSAFNVCIEKDSISLTIVSFSSPDGRRFVEKYTINREFDGMYLWLKFFLKIDGAIKDGIIKDGKPVTIKLTDVKNKKEYVLTVYIVNTGRQNISIHFRPIDSVAELF